MTFHKSSASSILTAALSLVPSVVVFVALYMSTWLPDVRFDSGYLVLGFVAVVLTILLMNRTFAEILSPEGMSAPRSRIIATWVLIIGVLLMLGYATKMSSFFSRRALFFWFVAGGIGLIASYHLLRAITARVLYRPEMRRNAVIAGISELSVDLARKITEHPELGLSFRGFFEDRSSDRYENTFDGESAGRLNDLPEFVKKHSVDVVFVALPIKHIQRVVDLLDNLHDTTASIYFVPDIFVFDLIQSRVQNICGLPAISLCETPFYGMPGLLKRVMDLVVATLALIVLSPIMIAAAIAVKVTSPGSVIFRQKRYGLDGREIAVYKFRTMRVSEDGDNVVQARRGDSRLTPVGGFLRKTSIDELPQLINVLQGRMSLVGPRPHAVAHNEEYRALIKGYMFRHKVLPGITGWAQINGYRGGTERLEDMRSRVEFDLDYLRHWSLAFDLKILCLTPFKLFNSDKAY